MTCETAIVETGLGQKKTQLRRTCKSLSFTLRCLIGKSGLGNHEDVCWARLNPGPSLGLLWFAACPVQYFKSSRLFWITSVWYLNDRPLLSDNLIRSMAASPTWSCWKFLNQIWIPCTGSWHCAIHCVLLLRGNTGEVRIQSSISRIMDVIRQNCSLTRHMFIYHHKCGMPRMSMTQPCCHLDYHWYQSQAAPSPHNPI